MKRKEKKIVNKLLSSTARKGEELFLCKRTSVKRVRKMRFFPVAIYLLLSLSINLYTKALSVCILRNMICAEHNSISLQFEEIY